MRFRHNSDGGTMNIENIRCFISLAECLNFTRAAAKEHITQTAMSRKISALEKELDVVLLYRDTRQVELTTAGNEFLTKAKELINLYDHTVKQVQNAQSDFQAELKLGVGVYDHVLVNRFLGIYVAESQYHTKISCQQSPYAALAKDFEDRLVDIAICTNQYEDEIRAFDPEHLESFLINDDEWYLILHRDNPLAQYERVPLSMLSTQTLLTMERGTLKSIKESFRHRFPIKDAIFVNSFDTKLVMANANFGITFAPPFCFPVADRYQNIVLRKTDPPYRARKFYAYYWNNNPNPMVHDFIHHYRAFCQKTQT